MTPIAPATTIPPRRARAAVGALPVRSGLLPAHACVLLAGALLCAAAAWLGQLRFGSSLYLFADVKGKPGALQGAMTALGSFLLAGGAFLWLRAGQLLRRAADPAASGGFAFAALLVWLAFDEVVMVHEWAAAKMLAWSVPAPWGTDRDAYVFAAYGLCALACLWRVLPVVRRVAAARSLLLLAVAFAAGSQALDLAPWDGLGPDRQCWLGPLEEGLKFLATLAGALLAHALLDGIEPAPA
jgi:hypothetical protein